jgi:anti-sigma regulatory factor (Ser/Thr protein kinase)
VMATVLYLVLDRETGELWFSAAGHPPPLVLGPDGPRFLEGGRSVPIGASDPAVFREANAVLPPGSSLLLYTDGLVERRDEALDRGLENLAAVAGAGHEGLDALCERVIDAVLARGEPGDDVADAATKAGDELGELCEHVIAAQLGDADPGDDVALLAVRPLPAPSDRISLTLPADPSSLARLRRRLARFLHATGASEAEQYEVMLTICEAAGNAIEHAYGPGDATFDVEVEFAGGELMATVRDSGSWRERRGEHRGRGLSIIEKLMDDVKVAAEDDGTVVTMRRRLAAERAA